MKTKIQSLFGALALLALPTLNAQFAIGQTTAVSVTHYQTNSARAAAIPFDQIGAVAGKQYSGDGLAVVSSPVGATLHCVFQRLDGRVTTDGLWLTSTKDGAVGKPFRVVACATGRDRAENLPPSGKVEVDGQTVRFARPGLIEEYSVEIDGLQQDFVIERHPAGRGSLRLELEVEGARAEQMAGGARLVLADGGRNMIYNRLRAMDARGKRLPARLEVESSNRLAVVLDDAAAEYPVRIDPTFSDVNWVALGTGVSGTGADGGGPTVFAIVISGANLFVGGDFSGPGGGAGKFNSLLEREFLVAIGVGSKWPCLCPGGYKHRIVRWGDFYYSWRRGSHQHCHVEWKLMGGLGSGLDD